MGDTRGEECKRITHGYKSVNARNKRVIRAAHAEYRSSRALSREINIVKECVDICLHMSGVL